MTEPQTVEVETGAEPSASVIWLHGLGADGHDESSQMLEELIAREQQRGIEPDRIVLAGFSQGGAIAINTLLRSGNAQAGLMGLSTWLPLPDALKSDNLNTSTPVFMAHGQFDPMIPMQYGRAAADALAGAGFGVAWHDYPMAHAVCPQEIDDIRTWLLRVLA